VAGARAHFERRIAAVRVAIAAAESFDAARAALLELAAAWTPDALAMQLRLANDLAALEGREAALAEAGGEVRFATEFDATPFREQIAYLTQKRTRPTKVWTDAMHGDHDRWFVVAGATDTAMLEEFQAAIVEGAQTYDIQGFAAAFDRIVETYGWSYNGGREWRIRTIFETNIRTSYMAGRLRQMRDPEMVKARPFWQYRHADTRVPLKPRPLHESWDDLVLRWDDPWWDTHFPPNDWACSCGVRSLSPSDLKRLGKSGPDTAPDLALRPFTHKASGQTVMLPDGIGFGWDHMPGDLWDRGLVPELLEIEALSWSSPEPAPMVTVDEREPMTALRSRARPFRSKVLPGGMAPEFYAAEFLRAFGVEPGGSRLWTDVEGSRLLISEDMLRQRNGEWKAVKRGHGDHALLIAETVMDPDEIWVSLNARPDPADPGQLLHEIVRRYIRVDPDRPVFGMFELGRRVWFPVTGFGPLDRNGPDFAYLDRQRVGKLIWKRK
jgi:hypothetical protein